MKILTLQHSSDDLVMNQYWEQMGHETRNYDPRKYKNKKGLYTLNRLSSTYRSLQQRRVGSDIRKLIDEMDPDLIVAGKAETVPPEALQDTDATKLMWFPDDPHWHDLARSKQHAFDAILTNSKIAQENYDIPALFWPFAINADDYGTEPSAEKEFDISYIGRHDLKRERHFKIAAEAADTAFAGGPGWPEIDGITTEDTFIQKDRLIDIYQRSRAVINVAKNREHITLRLFEAGACGTPVISEACVGIEEFFTPGEDVLLYNDMEELQEVVKDILPDGDTQEIGTRARERVLDEYTYKKMAEKILNVAVQIDDLEGKSYSDF